VDRRRRRGPRKTAFFAESVSFTVQRVFLPAALVVIASGVGLTQPGTGTGGSRSSRLTSSSGPEPGAGAAHAESRVWLSRALVAVLVLIVFLMTVKPDLSAYT
jgi:hypothetical protein